MEDGMGLDEPAKTRTPLPLQNTYAAKKTMAQGMMDVALVMANANQMRFVLEYSSTSGTYYLVLGLIVISLFLQVAVGISLIFKGRCDLAGDAKLKQANHINNWTLAGVFLITIVNIFITAFSNTSPAPGSASSNTQQQPPM